MHHYPLCDGREKQEELKGKVVEGQLRAAVQYNGIVKQYSLNTYNTGWINTLIEAKGKAKKSMCGGSRRKPGAPPPALPRSLGTMPTKPRAAKSMLRTTRSVLTCGK